MKQKIIITGWAGFIGSNFLNKYVILFPSIDFINIDALTYAWKLENISEEVKNAPNYFFEKVDIRDINELKKVYAKYSPTDIIHFAAESHVDNSITNPIIFTETNVIWTQNLLDCHKSFWLNRFHHISTDEVYGTLEENGYFTEKTPYAPNSPYSASKAGSDMIVRSYNHTFGLNTIITNCSNNYGPKQHSEKLIPKIIRNAIKGNPIPIYGDGKNIRDWLYVLDHCKGIDTVYHRGKSGDTYNIGGNNEKDNVYIANKICEVMDCMYPSDKSYKELITFVADRPGHDKRYAIDVTKIKNELGWHAKEDFESGITKTIEWYLKLDKIQWKLQF